MIIMITSYEFKKKNPIETQQQRREFLKDISQLMSFILLLWLEDSLTI